MNVYIGASGEVKNIYIGEYGKPDYLCFTAKWSSRTVRLRKSWSPTSVTIETSTDGENWSTYTIWNTITLSTSGKKVYFRNASETDTRFSLGSSSGYYYFTVSWSMSVSWDVNVLLNKNSTKTLSDFCFYSLFLNCTDITTPPSLPSTTLPKYCYYNMFKWCTSLTTVPQMPATTLSDYSCAYMFSWCSALTTLPELHATTLVSSCYDSMFSSCSKIKLRTSSSSTYNKEYRIPITWTGTATGNSLSDMFSSTWWSFTGTPSINTTYYTSNTIV